MGKPERVLNLDPLRHVLARFLRRLEFDLTGGANSVFSETVRNSPYYSDAIEFSVRQQQDSQNYIALNAGASRFAGVAGLGTRKDLGFNVNFLGREACDFRWIEKMCKRAVAGAAIVLISFRGHLFAPWLRQCR